MRPWSAREPEPGPPEREPEWARVPVPEPSALVLGAVLFGIAIISIWVPIMDPSIARRWFSLPNFYFHATTAYDILRHNGVELGKRDFMGAS